MHVFLLLLAVINFAAVEPYGHSPLFRMKKCTTQMTSPDNPIVRRLWHDRQITTVKESYMGDCNQNDDKEANFCHGATSSKATNVEIDDSPKSKFDPIFTKVRVVCKTLSQLLPILLLSLALWYSSGPVLPADALTTTDHSQGQVTTLVNGPQQSMDLAYKKMHLLNEGVDAVGQRVDFAYKKMDLLSEKVELADWKMQNVNLKLDLVDLKMGIAIGVASACSTFFLQLAIRDMQFDSTEALLGLLIVFVLAMLVKIA